MIKVYRYLTISFLMALLLVGCSQENPAVNPSESETVPTIATPTEVPTEAEAPPVIILLAGAGSDPAILASTQSQVEQIAIQQGLVFESRQNLSVVTAPENLRLVVVLPPINDLAGLAVGLPASKFIALNVPEISSTANLIAVGGGQASDHQAFIAGYIAAVQADDWRVGLIYPGEESGRNYKNAFLAGAVYFCGFCNPYYPPYYEYPVYYEVPPEASLEALQQAANELFSQGVNTVHLAPGADADELFRYLAERGMRFVGTSSPPAGLEGYWIASVLSGGEIDLNQLVAAALTGQMQVEANGEISISFTGLSEARIASFMEIVERLESGEIDPQGGVIE